ncbi:MAG: hypothetical protein V4857_08420 [Pseudomonadota bacterium]
MAEEFCPHASRRFTRQVSAFGAVADPDSRPPKSGQVARRSIDRLRVIAEDELSGRLHGWDGATIFSLSNGQSWQQSAFRLRRLHLCRPQVRVWRCGDLYWLEIEGAGELLPVRRIA